MVEMDLGASFMRDTKYTKEIVKELDFARERKVREIENCLNQSKIEIQKLQELGISKFGFCTSALRKKIYLILIDIPVPNEVLQRKFRKFMPQHGSQKEGLEIKFASTIKADVKRSFIILDYCERLPRTQIKQMQKELLEFLLKFFQNESQLSYFQGFNYIVVILYLILGPEAYGRCIQLISYCFLHDWLRNTFKEGVIPFLTIILHIVECSDPKLYYIINQLFTEATFLVGPMLTWFANNSTQFGVISRIFDFIICTHPLGICYLLAAVLIGRRSKILTLQDPQVTDFYCLFQNIEFTEVELENACGVALELMQLIGTKAIIERINPKFDLLSPVINYQLRIEYFYKYQPKTIYCYKYEDTILDRQIFLSYKKRKYLKQII